MKVEVVDATAEPPAPDAEWFFPVARFFGGLWCWVGTPSQDRASAEGHLAAALSNGASAVRILRARLPTPFVG